MKWIVVFTGLVLFFVVAMPFTGMAFKDMNLEEVRAAAEKGDVEAQTKLGVAYSTGIHVEVDKKKAAEWYKKAADQGYATGQWNLAFMYIRGEGVEQDDKKARKLFSLAAEQGFAPAEYDLGMMHLYGMGGKRDRTTALKWIRKASDQGYTEAVAFLRAQGDLDSQKKKKPESGKPKPHLQ